MKPTFTKLPYINFKNIYFQNSCNSKNNDSILATLTKSMSLKKSTSFNKKGNESLYSVDNSSTNLKIIGLKNLINNNTAAATKRNSLFDKNSSRNSDIFADYKKEYKLFKEIISPINNDAGYENPYRKIESYNNSNNKSCNKNEVKENSPELKFIKSFHKIYSKNRNKSMNDLYNDNNNNQCNKKDDININIKPLNKEKTIKKIKLALPKFYHYKTNTMSVKRKFKNEDIFIKYILERFIDSKNISPKDKNHRVIYIILEGTIIINYNNIHGYFINIPTVEELKKLNKEKRMSFLENLLKNLKEKFDCRRPIKSIFSPDKEPLLDILDIKDEFKYIYISQSIICKGISIVSTSNFIELYNTDFKDYLKQKKIQNNKIKNIKVKMNKFKIKKIIYGINPKKEKLKPHYSFASGENEIKENNYVFYSDNEDRKNKAIKGIHKNCFLKHDFFLYINQKGDFKKIKKLNEKLKFKKPFNLEENYRNYKFDFDKVLNRYKKELSKKYGIDLLYQNSTNKNDEIFDFHYLDKHYKKLYIKKGYSKIELNKIVNKKVYYNIDKNVDKYYGHFILYNIPKLLKEYKSYTRRRLYEVFAQYKDLISFSFSMSKSEFILKNGVDFQTFWNCIEELAEERESFAKKLFKQINTSPSSLLNAEDFIRGMYFIKNSELTEKLELFLKALDISGKGVISYDEAVEISKESILRNLEENNKDVNKNKLVLNELSNFFAGFVFKFIGVEKDQLLKIDDLRTAIIEGNHKNLDIEYLQMFCGADKN